MGSWREACEGKQKEMERNDAVIDQVLIKTESVVAIYRANALNRADDR